MSEVARVAGMSVGQIYRYFPSKDAIVLAIVNDIVERRIARMASHPDSPATPERLSSRAVEWDARHREDAILMFEISAEATRNPEIAQMVRQADQRSQLEARRKMMRRFPDLTEAQAAARCEAIAVLIEGTVARRMTQLQAPREEMLALYEKVIAAINGA
ncbi:transcriptional regulator, TetR family [Variovorax sp. YR216]|nr:transcriptional regulator, TetR family [Variovorax sp. YR216]